MRTLIGSCLVVLCLWTCGPALAESTVQVLHDFSGTLDGATPKGSLTLVDGVLFGRTALGGASNNGAIFSYDLNGATFTLVYSFTAGASNGTGNQPHHDSMTLVGSTLYGAALYGGNTNNGDGNGNGVVFSVATSTGTYAVVSALSGGTLNSSESHSCFLASGSTLYGMSAKGGVNGEGTIYSIDSTTGAYSLLYSFATATGSQPHGRLIFASNGTTMLGMTRKGGSHGYGVIFGFTPGAGTPYQVLHNFAGGNGDGATTDHGFLVLVGTTVYGMTTNGGVRNKGVIFSMSETGAANSFSLLHTFGVQSDDGSEPYGSLTLSNNYLYGMTRNGGKHGDGTIFRVGTDGKHYSKLASFDASTTGGNPIDNVTISADGSTLYGLTQTGGANDPAKVQSYGSIFSMTIPPVSGKPD